MSEHLSSPFNSLVSILTILTVLSFADSCYSSGSSPRLNLITPRGVQRGNDHTLRFSGERLSDTAEIFLYDSSVKILKFKQIDDKNVDVDIRVLENCRPGEHIAQIRTSQGISDYRSFFVGVLPDVNETEPNDSLLQCQNVQLDHTVNGVITNEDIDVFRVDCKKGQRLSVEIEAIRLGFMFDSFVAVLNEDNFELAISDDSTLARQDGVISLEIPADGPYFVLVRESSYGGSPNSRYRLHIGQFPRPSVVYPAGGPAGMTQSLQFFGDASGEIARDVAVPANKPFRPGLFLEDDRGLTPSPVAFRLSNLKNHFEVEPNHERDRVTDVHNVPCALNGIIGEPSDIDYFKFSAKKGQVFDIELFARRVRSGLDPVLNIFNAKGKHLVGDDDARRPDCYLKFTIPETGEYFLRVRDHLNRGQVDFVYRIEISPVKPKLSISIPRVDRYSQLRQKICVAQGNRFATMISASRINFGGRLELLDANWPDGVSIDYKPMVENLNLMPVVFTATDDAPLSGKLVDLNARHIDLEKKISGGFNISADFALGPPNNSQYFTSDVDKLACAVTKKLPFKIDIVQPKVPLVRNGIINLKVVAERLDGFDQPIDVQFPFRPPGVGTKPQIQIKKGESEAYYPLNANANAQIGTWPIYVIGKSEVNGPAWASSQLADLEIAEPFVTMDINRTSIEQGQDGIVFCKLQHLTPFEGRATAEILGIPPNIDIPKLTFTRKDQELSFAVKTTDKSRIGKHKGLFCRVTLTKNGESIVSTAARSELRINKPKPQKNVADVKKAPPKTISKPKAKSRLQQLRETARAKSGK